MDIWSSVSLYRVLFIDVHNIFCLELAHNFVSPCRYSSREFMFYEHRLATPLLLNIVKKTAGHSVVRPGIPNSCNSGIWWLLAILRHGIVHTEPWEVQGFSFVLILNVSELCSRRWKLIMTTEPFELIFSDFAQQNSTHQIQYLFAFYFYFQCKCAVCV